MAATIFCVVCGNETSKGYIGGHVHKIDEFGKNENVFAATCSDKCSKSRRISECKGCYGEWKPEHGYNPSFGPSFGYIDTDGFHEIDQNNI